MRKRSGSSGDAGTADTPEPVQRITNAPESLAQDQGHRMRVYGLQMLIRVVCLFLAVLIPHPVRWAFVVGAVFIPYLAVLLANAGRDRVTAEVILLDPRQITGSSAPKQEPSPAGFPKTFPSSVTPETER